MLCNDEFIKKSKDGLVQRINDNKINDSDELYMYYAYLFPALKEYCSMLKRELDDEITAGEDFQSTRVEYRLACRIRDAVSNFTNIC